MALRIQKILVGLDASARAPGVLATAVELARKFGASRTLFRAVGLPAAGALAREAQNQEPGELQGILEHHAEHDLEEWARSVPEGIAARTLVHLGTPADAICRAAIEEDADLVV